MNDRPVKDLRVPADAVPFVAVGAAAVAAGGIVAAVTGPTGWSHGSWVAAFLVLVGGIGQIGLGVGQGEVAEASRPLVAVESIAYNLGSALVLVGTLVGAPAVVTVGGAVLIVALGAFLVVVRRSHRRGWSARLQAALLVVIVVSIPVGIALSWIRN